MDLLGGGAGHKAINAGEIINAVQGAAVGAGGDVFVEVGGEHVVHRDQDAEAAVKIVVREGGVEEIVGEEVGEAGVEGDEFAEAVFGEGRGAVVAEIIGDVAPEVVGEHAANRADDGGAGVLIDGQKCVGHEAGEEVEAVGEVVAHDADLLDGLGIAAALHDLFERGDLFEGVEHGDGGR